MKNKKEKEEREMNERKERREKRKAGGDERGGRKRHRGKN